MDAPLLLQAAIAAKLQDLGTRVQLFSDSFRKAGNAVQPVSCLVGHASSEYQWAVEIPQPTGLEIATFEIRIEAASIHSHNSAFSYLGKAMNLLRGFTPITDCSPLAPLRYAPQGYDQLAGTWVYTGLVRSAIKRPGEYRCIAEIPPITEVRLGLWREGFLQAQFDVDIVEATT